MQYPFFSDELFRWCHWDGKNADGLNAGIKSGNGWSRPIGYTPKEYDSLIAKCKATQTRLGGDEESGLSFLDLEKAAYVLGKEKAEIEEGGGELEQDMADEVPKDEDEQSAKGKKRSAISTAETASKPTRPKRTKK
jgi:hypothetical protein